MDWLHTVAQLTKEDTEHPAALRKTWMALGSDTELVDALVEYELVFTGGKPVVNGCRA